MGSEVPIRRSAAPPRETWVDAAKGVAIILVVLFHAVIFLEDIALAGAWSRISGPLDTFRMPLFFFSAGLFAQRALSLSFFELFRTRTERLVWLYAVWTLLWYLIFQVLPIYRDTEDAAGRPLLAWVRAFIWPNESTWFIYALAWYFTLAWLARRVPVWLQLGAAGVLSAAVGSSLVDWPNAALEKSATYFVFFLAAVHFGRGVRAAVAGASSRAVGAGLVIGGLVYVTATALILLLGISGVAGVRLVMGVLGVLVGIALAKVLTRARWLGWLVDLGGQTLPIYLLHFYAVLGAVALLAPHRSDLAGWSGLLVPIVTVLAIAASLLVHRLTLKFPGLWSPPWTARVGAERAGA